MDRCAVVFLIGHFVVLSSRCPAQSVAVLAKTALAYGPTTDCQVDPTKQSGAASEEHMCQSSASTAGHG
ncbi:hypothetical protein WJX72_006172 [[Myrmecia] bisecta]|uniref:Secreted protein n=1 Tax=[Myrmecia] bisecta TaxID=41462 RepID=A0AAW1QF80_9CHLO